jgi:hypothetical protein
VLPASFLGRWHEARKEQLSADDRSDSNRENHCRLQTARHLLTAAYGRYEQPSPSREAVI